MAMLTKVAKTSEVPQGTGKVIEVAGKTLALFNCEGTFYAIENECKHRGGPLGEGSLEGGVVTCPWHGWEYEVASGACRTNPSVAVQAFEVKVEGDDVLIRL
ncbi:MAG: Rieske (2Fe-2S) protein [Candidatus Omnitrophota bacterium]|nr:Rieske (2Fe-2S) protein [Candidatus Omnitrophota bacterium]